jgi:hypothetical protein
VVISGELSLAAAPEFVAEWLFDALKDSFKLGAAGSHGTNDRGHETALMREVEEAARRLSESRDSASRSRSTTSARATRPRPSTTLSHRCMNDRRSVISGLRRNQEGETLIRTLVQLGKALSIARS